VDGLPTSLLDLGYSNVGLDDCYQDLLSPSCHYPGFGINDNGIVTSGLSCTDPNVSFPIVKNTQCEGLAGPLNGVSTADECAAACCADSECGGWQFCASGQCTGSNAPPNSCYTGSLTNCGTQEGWIGRAAAPLSQYNFHDNNGRTVVNKTRFPDLIAMTSLAHSFNLTAGFYMNNCFCHDHCSSFECFLSDIDEAMNMGFDAIKFDGCGTQKNMTTWGTLLNNTSKASIVVLENCNNDNGLIPRKGQDLQTVPFHFYRTSTDIRPTYGSFVSNGQTILHLTTASGPYCWGYSDMLVVGVTTQILTGQKVPDSPRSHWGEKEILYPGTAAYESLASRDPLPPVLNYVENRAHFSMWCILSSPLTLSIDFTKTDVVDMVWPIITNKEAIAVNQDWAGALGGLFFESKETVTLLHCAWIWAGDPNCTLPVLQYIYKPLSNNAVAVLVMNHGNSTISNSVNLTSVPGLACASTQCSVRDINAQTTRVIQGEIPFTLESHDVGFFKLS
jgi:hypothetical protein